MSTATSPAQKTSRELLRADYREWLKLKAQEIASGPLEGKRVVLWEDVEWVLGRPFPPASEHGAEVTTPARVVVYATCPSCNLTAPVAIEITPELRVDSQSGHLHVKAKAKPASHACGQLVADLRDVDGQGDFGLEDIIGYDSQPLQLGDIVRVADGGAGSLIGPIVRYETSEEVAEAVGEGFDEALGMPPETRQIVVADPEDSEHVVFAFPVDADRLTAEELETNLWTACDAEACPLALGHKGAHVPLEDVSETREDARDSLAASDSEVAYEVGRDGVAQILIDGKAVSVVTRLGVNLAREVEIDGKLVKSRRGPSRNVAGDDSDAPVVDDLDQPVTAAAADSQEHCDRAACLLPLYHKGDHDYGDARPPVAEEPDEDDAA